MAIRTDTGVKLMKRGSPPTDRVIETLELLAAHPTERFSLTDIVRRLDITKATCHVVLRSLTESGYVVRDPKLKTYGLGPSLIALGRAAQESFPSLDIARQEMLRMSKELAETFSAAAIIDDQLVVLERVGPNAPNAPIVGTRVPYAPPMGAGFVAWGDEADFDAWVARSERSLAAADVERLRASLAAIRELGYGVERLSAASIELRAFLEAVPDDLPENVRAMVRALTAELGPEHYLTDEIRGASRLSIGVMHAPVFNHEGNPELSIAASIFRKGVTRREIDRIAKRLVDGATAVTTAIGGRAPDGAPVVRRSRARRSTAPSS